MNAKDGRTKTITRTHYCRICVRLVILLIVNVQFCVYVFHLSYTDLAGADMLLVMDARSA